MQQAVCVRRKTRKTKKQKIPRKSAPSKTHHEIHTSSPTATTSRRRATSVVGTLCAPRYEEAFFAHRQKMAPLRMKRLFCPIGKTRTSVASLPRPCLITSREVNEARRTHTCSRPCAFEEKKREKNMNPA